MNPVFNLFGSSNNHHSLYLFIKPKGSLLGVAGGDYSGGSQATGTARRAERIRLKLNQACPESFQYK